jgi:thioredoxin 1
MTQESINESIALNEKVIIMFGTYWNLQCYKMKPILEQIIEDGIKVVNIDIEVDVDLKTEYNISMIPTMLCYKNGNLVDNIVGISSKDMLIEELS